MIVGYDENNYPLLLKSVIKSLVSGVIRQNLLTASTSCDFFNSYLAAPQPTLSHYRGDNLTHPTIITAFFTISNCAPPPVGFLTVVF